MSRPPLADLAVETPATIAMAARARALRAEGHDVISLAIGEPDFPTPPHVIEAAHRAASAGETRYTPVEGTAALRSAIAERFTSRHGVVCDPRDVIVTTGAKQAIHDAFAATIAPGSEIVIPAPYWASYPLIAAMQRGRPVFVACREQDRFRLDPHALEAAITPATRWLVLNSPNNPTGAVLDRDRLEAIAGVLARHPHVWVLADDIYDDLILDDTPSVAFAPIAGDRFQDRVLTIGGVSKSHAMTGWRIGWATGPRRLIERMAVVQGNVTSGACSVSQAAAVAALTGDQSHLAVRRRAYRARRDFALEALARAPLLHTQRPEGAFYLFASVAGLIGRRSATGAALIDDAAVAHALLEEAHVAAVPGAAFGTSPYLRLSTATDPGMLEEACRRIVRFCEAAG